MKKVFFKIQRLIEFLHWINIKLVWSSWFCAKFEKNYLQLLAMEREQKNKLSFSFKQIFDEGVFVLGRLSFLRFYHSSLGSPMFSSSFFEKIFCLFLFNDTLHCVFSFFIFQFVDVKFPFFLNFLNSLSLIDVCSVSSPCGFTVCLGVGWNAF